MKINFKTTINNFFARFGKGTHAGRGFAGHRQFTAYGNADRDWQIVIGIFVLIVIIIVFFNLVFFHEIGSGEAFGGTIANAGAQTSSSTPAFNRTSMEALIGAYSARASLHSSYLSGFGAVADPSL